MWRIIIILTGLQFCLAGIVAAQSYEQDSVWVSDLLSRGGEYRLNEETWNAIRNGTLLKTDNSPFRFSPSTLPIVRDFEIKVDDKDMFEGLDLWHLSPDDVLLYRPLGDSILVIHSAAFTDYNTFLVKEYAKIPHSLVEVNEQDYLPEIQVWDGEWRGTLKGAARLDYSGEDVLEDVFSPTERHKHKNRKEADAWKYYNMEPLYPADD